MKFCYVDETGSGDEGDVFVMAGGMMSASTRSSTPPSRSSRSIRHSLKLPTQLLMFTVGILSYRAIKRHGTAKELITLSFTVPLKRRVRASARHQMDRASNFMRPLAMQTGDYDLCPVPKEGLTYWSGTGRTAVISILHTRTSSSILRAVTSARLVAARAASQVVRASLMSRS
jgi:hypothetical protein